MALMDDNIIYPLESGSGSGLPDVEGSGKALVSVDGEWKEQDGYGYETVTEQAIFEGEVTTFGEEGEISIGEFPSSIVIEEGKTYKVIFEGNEYEIEGKKSFPQAGIDVFFLGEMTEPLQPSFINYPFVLFYMPMEGTELYTETAGTYSVKIRKPTTQVHKIDSKYIPAAGTLEVQDLDTTTSTEMHVFVTTDETVEPVENAIIFVVEEE